MKSNTRYRTPKGQSKTDNPETGNIGYTRRIKNKTKTQHNMCWKPLYANKHK